MKAHEETLIKSAAKVLMDAKKISTEAFEEFCSLKLRKKKKPA